MHTVFVVLCFVVVMQSFIMNSHEVFIHIHQGCFAGTGAIVKLPQCQWSKPDGYGKISQCITTTKLSKNRVHISWDILYHYIMIIFGVILYWGWFLFRTLIRRMDRICHHGPLARYVKMRVAHAPGRPGTFPSPPRVSVPDMHHGTRMTHVSGYMPGSLIYGFLWSRWRIKLSRHIPAHAQPTLLCIWKEAHGPPPGPPRGILDVCFIRIPVTYFKYHQELRV